MCETKGRKVYLIGIGMGGSRQLTEEAQAAIGECGCMIGAARMLGAVPDFGGETVAEYRPKAAVQWLLEHSEHKKSAVLLSGDVGFYSGAKKLEEALEEAGWKPPQIIRIPGISTVVYLASKLHLSWEDVKLVSLHGRRQNFLYTVAHNEKTFLLLGQKDSGRMVREKLLYYGLDEVIVHVGKRLSYPDEEIFTKKAGELEAEDLEGLCGTLIVNPHPDTRVCRHLRDEEFLRGKVPMTKEEVRTLALAKLELTEDAVLYDIGAGTGSVSVEAALQSGKIRVCAVEKNPEGIGLIRENCRRFCTDQVEILEGTAPKQLEELEPPTHVFIGGSSGKLREILEAVYRKNKNVRIVLTAISLDTLREVMEAVEEGLLEEPEIVQIMAARSRKLGRHHMMTGQNPIYLISAGGGRTEAVTE